MITFKVVKEQHGWAIRMGEGTMTPFWSRDLAARRANSLAAAIRCGADLIVTFNLKDFPESVLKPYGIEAQHPDDFLAHQFDLAPNIVCAAAKTHRASLKKPPMTVDEYLAALERQSLAQTVSVLRRFADLI